MIPRKTDNYPKSCDIVLSETILLDFEELI